MHFGITESAVGPLLSLIEEWHSLMCMTSALFSLQYISYIKKSGQTFLIKPKATCFDGELELYLQEFDLHLFIAIFWS